MKILLPLDGSEVAERAIPAAMALAHRWRAEIVAVRVVDVFVPNAPTFQPSLAVRLKEHEVEEARGYLASLSWNGVPHRFVTVMGSPRKVLVDIAEQERCDLIVMASHGRSGVERWLLGSVAESVLRRSGCPVLLVRPGHRYGGFQRALVPVDGYPASLSVLHKLEPFLAPHASITLLRATEAQFTDPQHHAVYLRSLEEDLRLLAVGDFEVRHRVVEGPPAHAILEFAEEGEFDLIAMATHARTGVDRLLAGSVTERVARHAPCLVLAFPPS